MDLKNRIKPSSPASTSIIVKDTMMTCILPVVLQFPFLFIFFWGVKKAKFNTASDFSSII